MKTSKSLVTLAIPAIIQNLAGTIMQYVDTAMVGRLGEEATVTVSTTTPVNWLLGCIPYALGVGALSVIAQALGAKDYEKIKRASENGFILTFILGGFLTLFTCFLAPKIPGWMNADFGVRKDAAIYFTIVSAALIFRTMGTTFGAMLSAVKNTRTPMLINLIANITNVILNYILIYIVGIGTLGAAIATATAHFLSGMLMMVAFTKNVYFKFNFKELHLDRDISWKIGEIGFPLLLQSSATCFAHVCFAGMVNSLGNVIYAAHAIAITAEEIFYIPGYGLRTATSTLIGISKGEKNKKMFDEVRSLSIRYTLIMMLISGLVLFVFAKPLMGFFTNSERVKVLGADVLRLVAVSEPFFGLMIAWEGVFYGLGKTKTVFFIECFCMWAVRVLGTFIVINYFTPSLVIIWCFMIADNVLKALLLTLMGRRLSIEKDVQVE